MIHRRGVLPVFVLLVLLIVGAVLQVVGSSGTATSGRPPTAAATPAPTSTPAARAVLRSIAGVERAYESGDVLRLCRPGALVDPAVIRFQNAAQGCERELESLKANVPRLQAKVSRLVLQSDLATATIETAGGTGATVDFVRRVGRWLLSFSDGADPLPALAGTT